MGLSMKQVQRGITPKFTRNLRKGQCIPLIAFALLAIAAYYVVFIVPYKTKLYVADRVAENIPAKNIPSAKIERAQLDRLYSAVKTLNELLNRTNVENTRICVKQLFGELKPYYSKARKPKMSATGFPYGAKNQDEVDEMFTASAVLLNYGKTVVMKNTRINRIYHQLNILRLREFPDSPRIDVCSGCMHYKFNHIISPKDICHGGEEIRFVNLITSIPNNVEHRKAVRNTWGQHTKSNTGTIRSVFLFGTGWSVEETAILNKEATQYGDILQDDFKDRYFNLTYKVLMGYQWALDSCPRAKYVMRAADDSYMHIQRILKLIEECNTENSFNLHQVGACFDSYKPYRVLDYKGYLSQIEYSRDTFPPYALGTNFLTSMQLTKDIMQTSADVPFFCIEDAYFGLVLNAMRRGCYNIPGFVMNYITGDFSFINYVICNIVYGYSVHPLDPQAMRDVHKYCTFHDTIWPKLLLYCTVLSMVMGSIWCFQIRR